MMGFMDVLTGGGGGGILGPLMQGAGMLMNKRSADKQHQYQTHVEQRNRSEALQFAQNAIQWRVDDAKKAGIHPLTAMGVQGFSPSGHMSGGAPMADMATPMGQIGQDIGRAIASIKTKDQKALMDQNISNAKKKGLIESMELDSRLKSLNSGGQTGPVVPTNEQTNRSGAINKINKDVTSAIGHGETEAGQPAGYQWFKSGKGKYKIAMSEAMKTANEETPGGIAEWIEMRLKGGKITPPHRAPKGKKWVYHKATGELILKVDYDKRRQRIEQPWKK